MLLKKRIALPMWTVLLLLLLNPAAGQGTVSASGGGIVKAGDDLVLTYTMTEEWERCYWYW